MEAVRLHFKPEFLNRLDEMIIFDRLGREDMGVIVELQLGKLETRLVGRNITLTLTDEAKDWLAREGYDPVFGARPLKRVFQRHLQDVLAHMILSGEAPDGTHVSVSACPEGLTVGSRLSVSERQIAQPLIVH